MLSLPDGCRFRPRCAQAFDRCTQEDPALAERGAGHLDACLLTVGQKRERRAATVRPVAADEESA
jgi:hypothetical protein